VSDLGATFAGIVTDGSLLAAVAVAALVGLISFASPCCLPLVPGYVSYVAGLAGADGTAATGAPTRDGEGVSPTRAASAARTATVRRGTRPAPGRRRLLAGSLLFVAGLARSSSPSVRSSAAWDDFFWSGNRYSPGLPA
jgi:cytochrome c-type biogenesis protein